MFAETSAEAFKTADAFLNLCQTVRCRSEELEEEMRRIVRMRRHLRLLLETIEDMVTK